MIWGVWAPKPPEGWAAHVDPDQLIVVWTHQQSQWRKYPWPGQIFIPADDHTFYCQECLWPKRWLIHEQSYADFCW